MEISLIAVSEASQAIYQTDSFSTPLKGTFPVRVLFSTPDHHYHRPINRIFICYQSILVFNDQLEPLDFLDDEWNHVPLHAVQVESRFKCILVFPWKSFSFNALQMRNCNFSTDRGAQLSNGFKKELEKINKH
ncbi:hypothetical protein I7I53_12254 [Histoplasma capsulatum var. duboisii H88]|uniref:Uncharacterized protein n=1 Tax=Ajellomyces capsulatus (strain H88) TaxID=544711 RepID=A0A8A1LUP4_AJEC8|nr:hypothetical protein I7I53_12254 [Histoplasma capsulatum var. duboisii H88]